LNTANLTELFLSGGFRGGCIKTMRIYFELKQLYVVRMMLKVMTAKHLTNNNAKAKTTFHQDKGKD